MGTGKILGLYDGQASSTITDNLAFGVYDGGYTQIYSTSTQTALRVQQSSTGDILNLFDGSTEVLTVLDGGYLGIGTTTPKSVLSVSTLAQAAPTTKLFTVASTTGATLFQVTADGNISAAGSLTLASDVSISRGAADRLDLATGDSFNLVSGNLQFGRFRFLRLDRRSECWRQRHHHRLN
ncbi:MAG: hypothetical protein UV78_C0059G0001, partial [Parcubacteria group bacterium GW2011_GWA2_43_17]